MGWGEAGGLGTTRSNWLGGQTPARVLAAAGTRVGERSAERPATGQPSDRPWINAGITSPDPAGNKQQPPPARAHPGQRAEPRPPLAAGPAGPRWHRCPGTKGSRGEPSRWPWLSAEPWAQRLRGAGSGGPGRILVWWGDASTRRARGGRWQGRKTDTFLNEAPSFSREKGSGVTPRGQLG